MKPLLTSGLEQTALPNDMLEAHEVIQLSLGTLIFDGAEKMLSEREMCIAEGAGRGESIKETAAQLCLGANTLKQDRWTIRDRLQVPGFSGVVYFAYANNLLPIDDTSRKTVTLSPVENLIMKYLLYGYSRVETAKHIGRSKGMVNDYVDRIYGKLEVNKRPAVVRRAFETGLCMPSTMIDMTGVTQ